MRMDCRESTTLGDVANIAGPRRSHDPSAVKALASGGLSMF